MGVVVENVNDLYSIPFLLQYNPAVISIEEVQHGGFLQGGNQAIAIVQRVDKERGQAISPPRVSRIRQASAGLERSWDRRQGARARNIESVDRAGQRQGLAAAADSAGHQRGDGDRCSPESR